MSIYIRKTQHALALAAGILPTLALAPFEFWPCALLGPALLALLLFNTAYTTALLRSWLFGLGLFGSGASWVYVSIHDFGFTGATLAMVMTFIFVAFLALVFAIPFTVFARFARPSPAMWVAVFPALWVLGEWSRSWLLTGFPWLYNGYAFGETMLSAWAPIAGVWSLSFVSVFSGTLLGYCAIRLYGLVSRNDRAVYNNTPQHALLLLLASVAWLVPAIFSDRMWTHDTGIDESIAIIQPNIPLPMKWDPFSHPEIMAVLDDASSAHWDKSIQFWPEAAIPGLLGDAQYFANDISERARASHTNIFAGALSDDWQSYSVYNSIIGLGVGSGVYHKQRLVPFGEYVPLESYLRGVISFFDLPSSVIRVGPNLPSGLSATSMNGELFNIAPYICYEIVYPDLVAENSANSELMVTISNDAWFGDSIGPLQHFEMARMRAMENQKYLVRATNTGISGIIDWRGKVVAATPQFERTTLSGTVRRINGTTPFTKTGSWPVVSLCFLLVLLGGMPLFCNMPRMRHTQPDLENSS